MHITSQVTFETYQANRPALSAEHFELESNDSQAESQLRPYAPKTHVLDAYIIMQNIRRNHTKNTMNKIVVIKNEITLPAFV